MKHLRTSVQELGYRWNSRIKISFETYLQELKKWNAKMNITSIENDEEIEIKHFVDSLQILRVVKRGKLIDVGPGGGFPSLPAKIVEQNIDAVLIEASLKKTRFLKHIIRILTLRGIAVIHGRAEDEAIREKFSGRGDYITGRAVTKPERFLKFVHPLAKKGGRIIYMLGPNQPLNGLREMGARYSIKEKEVISYTLPKDMGKRIMWIGEKV